MDLPKIIQVGSNTDHVSINCGVPYGHGPLDIDSMLAELDKAHNKAQIYLARTKFAYDISMLRAALYAITQDITMEEAIHGIENVAEAETAAITALNGYLAAQGWRPYEPVDARKPVFENGRQVQMGTRHHGDVIVNLSTGITLVPSGDAYTFHWDDVSTRKEYEPRPYERWWFVRNFKKGLKGKEVGEARLALTIPAVPADLDALIAQVKTKED